MRIKKETDNKDMKENSRNLRGKIKIVGPQLNERPHHLLPQ